MAKRIAFIARSENWELRIFRRLSPRPWVVFGRNVRDVTARTINPKP